MGANPTAVVALPDGRFVTADRLSDSLLRSIEQSERLRAGGTGMHLRIAVDYSSQYSILEAARRAGGEADLDSETFKRLIHEVDHCAYPAGDTTRPLRSAASHFSRSPTVETRSPAAYANDWSIVWGAGSSRPSMR